MPPTRHSKSTVLPFRYRRNGVEVLELVLVLPILILSLVAAIQFASVLVVDTTLSHASLEVARLAAMDCTEVQITDRVNEFLAVHDMTLGVGSQLIVEDASGVTISAGDGSLSPSVSYPPISDARVRATLIVETNATPIPNALRNYCVDFADRQFEHTSVVLPVCECP